MLRVLDIFLARDPDEDTQKLIIEFDILIKGHIALEELQLYPVLDESLTDKEKKEVAIDLKDKNSGYVC